MILYEKRFYELVSPSWVKKKRKCLRCGFMKVSLNAGDRYCSGCRLAVSNVGASGE
jgi:ribosomal protein S27AE